MPVKTEIGAWLSSGDSEPIPVYTARSYVKVRLNLTSAGPCEISTRVDGIPLGSGKGYPLITDVEKPVVLAPGTILYLASDTLQRVAFSIEPTPFAEIFVQKIDAIFNLVRSFFPSGVSAKKGGC